MPETPWKNRIVGHGVKPASQFLANPFNWRVHPPAQQRAVQGSLASLGWIDTVIENITTGHLVDGHERIWEALDNGDCEVPYIQVELTEDEERLALTILDPITGMATGDPGKFDEIMKMVNTDNQAVMELINQTAASIGLYTFSTDDQKEAVQAGAGKPEKTKLVDLIYTAGGINQTPMDIPKYSKVHCAEILIHYKPLKLCLESKSLKLYLETFRDEGIFHEHLAPLILDDLVRVLDPDHCSVTVNFHSRGGIAIDATANYFRKRSE